MLARIRGRKSSRPCCDQHKLNQAIKLYTAGQYTVAEIERTWQALKNPPCIDIYGVINKTCDFFPSFIHFPPNTFLIDQQSFIQIYARFPKIDLVPDRIISSIQLSTQRSFPFRHLPSIRRSFAAVAIWPSLLSYVVSTTISLFLGFFDFNITHSAEMSRNPPLQYHHLSRCPSFKAFPGISLAKTVPFLRSIPVSPSVSGPSPRSGYIVYVKASG